MYNNYINKYNKNRIKALPTVEVSEINGIRSLHLNTETIQSSMDIKHPERLVLSYSRAMMSWLLFNNNPKKIIQIGLGGGSFSRWIAHYIPEAENIAIDINPQVISVAKSLFKLPIENEKFNIIEADGALYIKTLNNSTDIILVDAFDGKQIINSITEVDFFRNCLNRLSTNGIFVINLWDKDPRYFKFLDRLLNVFSGRVLEIPATSHGNVAVFAFREKPKECRLDKISEMSIILKKQFNIEFDVFFNILKTNNINNNGYLIL